MELEEHASRNESLTKKIEIQKQFYTEEFNIKRFSFK